MMSAVTCSSQHQLIDIAETTILVECDKSNWTIISWCTHTQKGSYPSCRPQHVKNLNWCTSYTYTHAYMSTPLCREFDCWLYATRDCLSPINYKFCRTWTRKHSNINLISPDKLKPVLAVQSASSSGHRLYCKHLFQQSDHASHAHTRLFFNILHICRLYNSYWKIN